MTTWHPRQEGSCGRSGPTILQCRLGWGAGPHALGLTPTPLAFSNSGLGVGGGGNMVIKLV